MSAHGIVGGLAGGYPAAMSTKRPKPSPKCCCTRRLTPNHKNPRIALSTRVTVETDMKLREITYEKGISVQDAVDEAINGYWGSSDRSS